MLHSRISKVCRALGSLGSMRTATFDNTTSNLSSGGAWSIHIALRTPAAVDTKPLTAAEKFHIYLKHRQRHFSSAEANEAEHNELRLYGAMLRDQDTQNDKGCVYTELRVLFKTAGTRAANALSGPRIDPTRSKYETCSFLNAGDAASEAKSLLPLIESGRETLESLRDLISISPRQARVLVRIEQKRTVDRPFQNRKAVLREFERLVTKDLEADVRKCP